MQFSTNLERDCKLQMVHAQSEYELAPAWFEGGDLTKGRVCLSTMARAAKTLAKNWVENVAPLCFIRDVVVVVTRGQSYILFLNILTSAP